MKLKRQSLVSKSALSRLIQAASESWKRCDFQKSIEITERLCRLDPANPGLFLELGGLYGKRYDYLAAERCFEQAVRIAPRKANALARAAQKCRDFRKEDMAEKYLRRAAEQKGAPPEILVRLAELYERGRRLAEAAELTDRALQSDPACAPALLLRAKLDGRAGQLEAAEKSLSTFPANADPILRAGAAYQLGNLLDRQGRYDEAMTAFLEAKSILTPLAERATAEMKIMRARVSHVIASTTAEQLQQWFDSADQLEPNHRLVLLGGHPRSGTTLLEQVLDSHPDIISAEETEIFDHEAYSPLLRGLPDDTAMYQALITVTPGQLQQARHNYFRAMELSLGNPIAGRLLIDKNPSGTFLLPAVVRIFPEIKLLIALRDPRDVVLSCFMQNIALNQAGAAYLSLAGAAREYAALMSVWQTIAPHLRNPHLEVRYEDMVENLEAVARRTLDFLGVSWDARVLGFNEHARQKLVRSPTYADVTQPVYRRAVGRWRNYQKYLEPHLTILEPFVKAFGYE